MLDLAAWYAPRGISPREIREMSRAERAALRVGRSRWYDDMMLAVAAGIGYAYSGGKEADNGGEGH